MAVVRPARWEAAGAAEQQRNAPATITELEVAPAVVRADAAADPAMEAQVALLVLIALEASDEHLAACLDPVAPSLAAPELDDHSAEASPCLDPAVPSPAIPVADAAEEAASPPASQASTWNFSSSPQGERGERA
mmetsp:Transcript_90588/g.157232  ORF Transcript_90588/g.157232 Transcript_90588/m.157232 type:complete len:135 (-) Transcript_90588:64-468(-)